MSPLPEGSVVENDPDNTSMDVENSQPNSNSNGGSNSKQTGDKKQTSGMPNRVKTRQDTDTARAQAFRKLLAALNEGFLSSDSEVSDTEDHDRDQKKAHKRKVSERTKKRPGRQSKSKHAEQGISDDEEYVQPESWSSDEYGSDMDFEDSAAPEQFDLSTDSGREAAAKRAKKEKRLQEKKLILRIKMAKKNQEEHQAKDDQPKELRFEDIDWSEVDLETINGILARREELRQRQMAMESGVSGGDASNYDITSSRLKKSSLAPPPIKIDRPKPVTPVPETVTEEPVSSKDLPSADSINQNHEQSSITSILAAAQASDEVHGPMTSESVAHQPIEDHTSDHVDDTPSRRPATSGKRGRPRGRPRGRGRGGRTPRSQTRQKEVAGTNTPLHLPPKSSGQNYTSETPTQAEYSTPISNRIFQSNFGAFQQFYDTGVESIIGGSRRGRCQQGLTREDSSGNANAKRDMRVVLQYELSHEQNLLKSLQSEIMDKLAQLKTEERLLRIVVGDQLTISDDEQDPLDSDLGFASSGAPQYTSTPLKDFSPGAVSYSHFTQSMDSNSRAHDAYHEDGGGDSSLSDMSDSEASEDEEVARNALKNLISQIDESA
ncbi:hypothetical protein H4219_000520 [Mycoemilia scoparia]|uniref:Uncharacterized protein n=1 Tax=Mycoemilia scoparia TaxID=417184 RepID=A0A9W8A3P6_9FUNG|nr:hypothetical protein H4219_000520 [Mycoemilia scoparia]